ncbi:DUF885 family protein [bacterium]|nr:DUF885 family protein [bacterium]
MSTPAAGSGSAKSSAGQQAFDKLSHKYFDWLMRQYPGFATYMGIHDYDSKLTNYAPRAIEMRREKIKEFHDSFKAIPVRELDADSKIERQLMVDTLYIQMQKDKNWAREDRDPGLYLDDAVYSCYAITVRDCGDAEEAAQKMTERLLGIPKLLGQAKKLVSRPTRINCETAIMAGGGAINFFKDTVAKFAKRVKEASTRQNMRVATQIAEDAVNDYLKWIEEEMLPLSTNEFAIGEDLFNLILKREHQLEMDSEELLDLGRREYRRTIKELEDTARRVSSELSWEELIDRLKLQHPTNSELVQYYADEMKRAKRFVIENRLVDIPEGEKIDVVPTPDFARPVIPYAAYVPPAPYDGEQRGIFWVTPVDKDKSIEEMEEQLRGHATHGIVVTALHEAYPGHHLQMTLANQLRHRPLRVLLSTSVFVEGWALYCEEMMWQQGFYDDLRSRLLQLKDQLWRACRVILDVHLHRGEWDFEKGIRFLVHKARLERVNAEAEVRRYCQSPTQPMSYIVGKMQVLDILDDYKKLRGNAFNIRQFHNELIRHGSLPLKQIRLLMNLDGKQQPEPEPAAPARKSVPAKKPAAAAGSKPASAAKTPAKKTASSSAGTAKSAPEAAAKKPAATKTGTAARKPASKSSTAAKPASSKPAAKPAAKNSTAKPAASATRKPTAAKPAAKSTTAKPAASTAKKTTAARPAAKRTTSKPATHSTAAKTAAKPAAKSAATKPAAKTAPAKPAAKSTAAKPASRSTAAKPASGKPAPKSTAAKPAAKSTAAKTTRKPAAKKK